MKACASYLSAQGILRRVGVRLPGHWQPCGGRQSKGSGGHTPAGRPKVASCLPWGRRGCSQLPRRPPTTPTTSASAHHLRLRGSLPGGTCLPTWCTRGLCRKSHRLGAGPGVGAPEVRAAFPRLGLVVAGPVERCVAGESAGQQGAISTSWMGVRSGQEPGPYKPGAHTARWGYPPSAVAPAPLPTPGLGSLSHPLTHLCPPSRADLCLRLRRHPRTAGAGCSAGA